MSVTTKVTLVNSSVTSAASQKNKFPVKSGDKFGIPQSISSLVEGMAGGSYGGSLAVQVQNGDAIAATATVTCASVSVSDTVTVGNVVFTAVAGTPGAHQFKQGVSNTADGLSLATAINSDAVVSLLVVASNASGVVTLTHVNAGAAGNAMQLSSSNNTRLAVVAFSGGVSDTASTVSTTY